eukprot:8870260-Pyramimonas_sp.AAC.1
MARIFFNSYLCSITSSGLSPSSGRERGGFLLSARPSSSIPPHITPASSDRRPIIDLSRVPVSARTVSTSCAHCMRTFSSFLR